MLIFHMEPLELLEQMVMMESPSFNKALVDGFGRFVVAQFAAIGGKVEDRKSTRLNSSH